MNKLKNYDKLYREASEILNKYDPCKMNSTTKICTRGTQGCCTSMGGCRHLNMQTGCRVKSIACKIWLCEHAKENIPQDALNELQHIWIEAFKLNFLVCRGSKAESTQNIKLGRIVVMSSPVGEDTCAHISQYM